jgi:2-oxoisovalerate dehydrogenase E2 component (dihydrolipoyl transacylase)
MSERRIFLLPDLGEGLPDAEIVAWAVAVGAAVTLDAPLVSMETAKAVVDVPAPFSGVLVKVFGNAGDVIATGQPLAEFALSDGPQRAAGHDTGHAHAAHILETSASESADAGSVVGAVTVGEALQQELPVSIGGVKAVPAVRALARKLGVDLTRVLATGAQGIVTLADVKQATQSAAAQSNSPSAELPTPQATNVEAQPLRGMRRSMARLMAQAHAQVVPTTLMEDATIQRWHEAEDLTVRLIRALVQAARAEPTLNAWFDAEKQTLNLHQAVHIGIAIDTDDGLFVANLRDAQARSASATRQEVARLRAQTVARNLAPHELSGYTLMLSNFGVYAGRYATPIIAPPCVAILAAGRARIAAVPVLGAIAAQKILPLSLTFDHRACTGGEAARFLKALLVDLEQAH